MGRGYSFIDSEFHSKNYREGDDGDYTRGLVAVAMPFKEQESDQVYDTIKIACEALGLNPHRVDKYVKSGVVIRDIAKLIEEAEFLIFDLTGERQNVYYELGYAHGVGNEAIDILLIAVEGTKLHYDIAGLRVHFYKSLEDLQQILSQTLTEMIRISRGSNSV